MGTAVCSLTGSAHELESNVVKTIRGIVSTLTS